MLFLIRIIGPESDRKGAKLACYQVAADNLSTYLDMGLVLVKLGEEGLVDLTSFSLDGPVRSRLRQAHNKMKRMSDITFEVLSLDQVNTSIVNLKTVSDDWLEQKKAIEKQFSLGFFNPDYILLTRWQ